MLEGGGCGQASCLLQFLDKLPGIGRVKEVDVTRLSIDDTEGQRRAKNGGNSGRLLLGVAAVLERVLGLVDAGSNGGL